MVGSFQSFSILQYCNFRVIKTKVIKRYAGGCFVIEMVPATNGPVLIGLLRLNEGVANNISDS